MATSTATEFIGQCLCITLYSYLFFFFLCNLRFLLGDHFGEFSFALVAGFGVDVELLSFAVWQARIEAAFPEMMVDLIDETRIGFADLIGYKEHRQLNTNIC